MLRLTFGSAPSAITAPTSSTSGSASAWSSRRAWRSSRRSRNPATSVASPQRQTPHRGDLNRSYPRRYWRVFEVLRALSGVIRLPQKAPITRCFRHAITIERRATTARRDCFGRQRVGAASPLDFAASDDAKQARDRERVSPRERAPRSCRPLRGIRPERTCLKHWARSRHDMRAPAALAPTSDISPLQNTPFCRTIT